MAARVLDEVRNGPLERLLVAADRRRLEEQIDVGSEKLFGGGRRYVLPSADDWNSAVASLSAQLDRIDSGWRDQLGFVEP